jgi:DNA-binding LytR/AlgR family response regulator
MKITALIIDDEPLAHDVILTFAKEVPFLEIVGQCYSATQAITYLASHQVDLVFLDIQMPMMTGIELLKVIQNKPQVIITSAYQKYALQGYEYDVTDYLLKPFRYDRFIQATSKVFKRLSRDVEDCEPSNNEEQRVMAEVTPLTKSNPNNIFIKVDRKQVQLALADISCFESYGNYVKVWRGDQSLLTPRTLTSFAETLPRDQFIRIHKSVIIQVAFIDFIEGNSLHLKGGQIFSIGKQNKESLREALT